jgi:hypothetical protein
LDGNFGCDEWFGTDAITCLSTLEVIEKAEEKNYNDPGEVKGGMRKKKEKKKKERQWV